MRHSANSTPPKPLEVHQALALVHAAIRHHWRAHGKAPVITWCSPALSVAAAGHGLSIGRADSLGGGYAVKTVLDEFGPEDLYGQYPTSHSTKGGRL